MSTSTFQELEAELKTLPVADQLLLLEHLAQHIRQCAPSVVVTDQDLERMAADPAIQRELVLINMEFGVADMDGLG